MQLSPEPHPLGLGSFLNSGSLVLDQYNQSDCFSPFLLDASGSDVEKVSDFGMRYFSGLNYDRYSNRQTIVVWFMSNTDKTAQNPNS